MKRAIAWGVLALMLAASGPVFARDTLVIGLSSFPSNMHPDINPEAVKSYIEGFALRPMTAFDVTWSNTCLYCTELPTLENGLVRIEERPAGAPGMAVTVKFKPSLKWGDGAPVTARDLAFTAKVGADPNSGFANTRTWGRVESVEVIDDLTAVMHLDEISTQYDRIGDLLPEHIEGPIYAAAKDPGDYINHSVYNRAPTTPGLWNGPFLVSDYVSGSTITLKPNPYWPGTKPGFARIVFRTIDNTAALLANLQSGDVDMTPGEGMGLSVDQSLALMKNEPDRFNYILKPALTYDHIDVQLDNPILADVRVRRALLHAIDRKTMDDRLFGGKFPIANSFVSPLEHSYTEDVAHYDFDPARAKALLAEAGWTPGPDGICRNAMGEKLSIEFRVTVGVKLRELMQQVIQSQWKNSCIESTTHNETPRNLFGETLKKRRFEGVVLYSWLFPVESTPRQILGSDQIPSAENNYSGTNYMDWHNATADAAINTIETELDPAKRQLAWTAIQQAYADELPVLPLFFRVEVHAVPKWLKGFTPTGHNDYAVYWAENWSASP
jgi:peptide/nickel transport system substrate-binding protein